MRSTEYPGTTFRQSTYRETLPRDHSHDWRYLVTGAIISVLPILIVIRMFLIQTNPSQVAKLREQIGIFDGETVTIQPQRGEIYDRYGNLLAGNKTVYEIGAELKNVRNPDTIAMTLSFVLGVDYNDIFARASQAAAPDAVYSVLARNASQDQVDQLKELAEKMDEQYASSSDPLRPSLAGLVYEPKLARSYPESAIGSNILGFVNMEGKGFFGVEEKFNSLLAGKPTTVFLPSDPNRVEEMPSVPPGASLVLTIDREVQADMESLLDQAIKTHGAESGTIVIQDPRNGEIIAMATTPRMDLNNYLQYLGQYTNDIPFNRAISQAYEPGSVYKVLTLAAALDSGAIQRDSTFLDTGVFEIGGIYIYNWNGGAWGPQDMTGCMQHSLNVCLAWMASKTGAKDFYAYMQAFGIGHLTGADMAGENPGRLKVPGDGDWYDGDLGTNSFGQGVAATPLQMSSAIASLANDGKLMTPHVVRSLVHKGYQYDIDPQVIGTPVKAETARTVTDMLAISLEVESSDAMVTGYRVAGKTGTAEIPTPFGYTSNQTNASFVGWGPADDPQFLVYVWLEKPSSSIWGSEVAAPVFREVVEHLVVLLDIPPDDIRHQLNGQ